MIKTIIFDLDGVLVEAKKIHYDCLNNALFEEDPKFIIEWNEHLSLYDGLKTNQKLDLLHSNKGLPKESFSRVWEKKQKLTWPVTLKIGVYYIIFNCCLPWTRDVCPVHLQYQLGQRRPKQR